MNSLLRMLWQWFQAWRFERAGRLPIANDVCVACDSINLTFPADRAYECQDCGYRGGVGWAQLERKKEDDGIGALDDDSRYDRAERALKQARTLVLSAQGTLAAAKSSNTMDMLGMGAGAFGAGEGSESQQELVAGMGDLLQAEREMEIASKCVRQPLPDYVRLTVELGYAGAAADQWNDSLAADMYTRSKIQQAVRHTTVMEQWITAALVTVKNRAI